MKKLSYHARDLLRRLKAGTYYPVDGVGRKVPRAMQELVDAGLVGQMGRIATIRVGFVPKGSKPLRWEKINAS